MERLFHQTDAHVQRRLALCMLLSLSITWLLARLETLIDYAKEYVDIFTTFIYDQYLNIF